MKNAVEDLEKLAKKLNYDDKTIIKDIIKEKWVD